MTLARQFTTPLAAAALSLSMVSLGIPTKTRAAGPPAPSLVEMAPEETPDRVGLRVDTDDLGGAGEPLKVKIVETATMVFAEQGFEDGRDGEDPRIVIVVERTGTEENPGFVVGFSIEKGDEIVPGSSRQSDCSLCTRTELVERIEQELPALLELAGEHQVPVEVGDEGGEDGGDGDGGEDLPGGGKKIGPLGFAGIGLGVVGLAGVGVGVAFAVRGVVPEPPDFLERTNYRTPGTIVLAVGGTALIAGVVMIAVDVSKRKKARAKSQSGAKTRIRPQGLGIAF